MRRLAWVGCYRKVGQAGRVFLAERCISAGHVVNEESERVSFAGPSREDPWPSTSS